MRPYLLEIREIIYFILAEVPGVCMANSFWKAFLLNQPPHTPYCAAAVPALIQFLHSWQFILKHKQYSDKFKVLQNSEFNSAHIKAFTNNEQENEK